MNDNQGKRDDQIKYSTMAVGWSIIGIIIIMILLILL